MSVIHKALGQLGQGKKKQSETIHISEERIKLERDLTTPTEKWFEMYKELGQKSTSRAKASHAKRTDQKRNRVHYAGLALLLVIFAFGGLTAFQYFIAPSYNSSPKIEVVHQFPEPHLQTVEGASSKSLISNSSSLVGLPLVARMPELTLTGIIEGSERIALINNRAVGEGQYIGNVLVKRIQGRRVILEFQGKELFLVL